jgi:hypothetical protein
LGIMSTLGSIIKFSSFVHEIGHVCNVNSNL